MERAKRLVLSWAVGGHELLLLALAMALGAISAFLVFGFLLLYKTWKTLSGQEKAAFTQAGFLAHNSG